MRGGEQDSFRKTCRKIKIKESPEERVAVEDRGLVGVIELAQTEEVAAALHQDGLELVILHDLLH